MFRNFIPRVIGTIKGAITKPTFQSRAIKKADKIQHGEKVLAPHYPTDERSYESVKTNEKIKKELETKHDGLIDKANKIHIKSTDVPESTPSNRYFSEFSKL